MTDRRDDSSFEEPKTLISFDEVGEGLEPMELDPNAWEEILSERRFDRPQVHIINPNEKYMIPRAKNENSRKATQRALDAEIKRASTAIKRSILQFGLHREFVEIFDNLLSEVCPIVVTPATSDSVSRESDFYVHKKPDNSFERRLYLNNYEIIDYAVRLADAFNSVSVVRKPEKRLIQIAGMQWLVGQKIMELVGTACYMRQTYGKYMQGFGGYTPHYLTRRELAVDYLSRNELTPDIFNDLDVDTERTINGFGLHWLAAVIIQYGLVDSEQKALLVIRSLLHIDRSKLHATSEISIRDLGRAAAHTVEDVGARISEIQPASKPKISDEAVQNLSDAIQLSLEDSNEA